MYVSFNGVVIGWGNINDLSPVRQEITPSMLTYCQFDPHGSWGKFNEYHIQQNTKLVFRAKPFC